MEAQKKLCLSKVPAGRIRLGLDRLRILRFGFAHPTLLCQHAPEVGMPYGRQSEVYRVTVAYFRIREALERGVCDSAIVVKLCDAGVSLPLLITNGRDVLVAAFCHIGCCQQAPRITVLRPGAGLSLP